MEEQPKPIYTSKAQTLNKLFLFQIIFSSPAALLTLGPLSLAIFTGMSGVKRKRPEAGPQGLIEAERVILGLIKSKKNLGIWMRDITQETKLANPVVTKSLKSLMSRNLIKDVVNIRNKGRKCYMAAEFEPAQEISGGVWYAAGSLDKELINVLKQLCMRCLRTLKVATLEKVHGDVKKNQVVTFEISVQQIGEILNSMVLDNVVIEVKSTGFGDFYSIPIGTTCYRIASGTGAAVGSKMGAFATIPCGACPRISLCTPNGAISPATCVYYTKWLNLDF